jgi:hypothetical protein
MRFHGFPWVSMRFYDVPVNQSVPTEANRGLTSYNSFACCYYLLALWLNQASITSSQSHLCCTRSLLRQLGLATPFLSPQTSKISFTMCSSCGGSSLVLWPFVLACLDGVSQRCVPSSYLVALVVGLAQIAGGQRRRQGGVWTWFAQATLDQTSVRETWQAHPLPTG